MLSLMIVFLPIQVIGDYISNDTYHR